MLTSNYPFEKKSPYLESAKPLLKINSKFMIFKNDKNNTLFLIVKYSLTFKNMCRIFITISYNIDM